VPDEFPGQHPGEEEAIAARIDLGKLVVTPCVFEPLLGGGALGPVHTHLKHQRIRKAMNVFDHPEVVFRRFERPHDHS
jgi:hypothetical protein